MGYSELNAHLFRNHVIDSPACAGVTGQMIIAVCQITSCTIVCLLYGSNNVDIKTNIEIFQHVHRYISEAKRFRTK